MRGKAAKNREILPDPRFGSKIVAKFINRVMQDGKKRLATKIVYGAIDELNKKTKTEGIEAFEQALNNVMPKMEVRSRRVGGANYQVPMPVRDERQESLAMRWIVAAARDSRKSTDFATQLGQELVSAYNREGTAYKKKEDVHRMAEANKAFSQFSW